MFLDRRRLRVPFLLASAVLSAGFGRAQCLSWSPGVGTPGVDDQVLAMAVFDDGHGPALYVGGRFQSAGGAPASCIAKWDGNAWTALGSGLARNSFAANAQALAVYDDGNGPALYVGGWFDTAGGAPASNVAKWDGSTWSGLGSGTDGLVESFAAFDDGSGLALYVGGDFLHAGGLAAPVHSIARWNGTGWSPLGSGFDLHPGAPQVHSLCAFDGGSGPELYAAGFFDTAGSQPAVNLATWNGSSWSGAGLGVFGGSGAIALTAFDDGSGPALYVGGFFTNVGPSHLPAQNVAKWNGSSWAALGNGLDGIVIALTSFDDGYGPALYAGGTFSHSGGTVLNGIARWKGSSWSPLGGGVGGASPRLVSALGEFDGGGGVPDLFAGGLFTRVAEIPSFYVAEWRGCTSSISLFCAGDGTVAICPCSNFGNVDHGCENSGSTGGASLSASGTTNPDTILLSATGELSSALSIFLQGDQILTGALPFGDGLRCVGGHLRRLYVKTAVAGSVSAPGPGDPSVSARSAALGDPLLPGTTRAYQTYYRDSSASFCPAPQGNTWNVTNGQIIRW